MTSEPHEFVADDRDEAIAKAARHFGLDAAALTICEFEPGEVYGMSGRVLVVAFPSDRPPPPPSRDRDRGESRSRDREERPRRGGRDRGERRERGGRGRGDRDRGERDRGERPPRAAAAEQPPAPSAPSVGTPRGELGEIGKFVLGVIERMDLGPFEIAENREDDLLVCQISGEAAGALGGGEGRAPDAIQLLANQVAMRLESDVRRVVVDVEGDRDAREASLSSLAERVARRARETGRAVALDPMNSRDRRMIHVALRDADDVATMSVGEGRYRQVVIVPEGAPEFEKAKRDSEGASSETSD